MRVGAGRRWCLHGPQGQLVASPYSGSLSCHRTHARAHNACQARSKGAILFPVESRPRMRGRCGHGRWTPELKHDLTRPVRLSRKNRRDSTATMFHPLACPGQAPAALCPSCCPRPLVSRPTPRKLLPERRRAVCERASGVEFVVRDVSGNPNATKCRRPAGAERSMRGPLENQEALAALSDLFVR